MKGRQIKQAEDVIRETVGEISAKMQDAKSKVLKKRVAVSSSITVQHTRRREYMDTSKVTEK